MEMQENKTEEGIIPTTSFPSDVFHLTNGTTVWEPVPRTPAPIGYYGDTRELLMQVLASIIIVQGTVGNILTIIALMRRLRSIPSTAMYLLALAVSDTCLLWCAPLRNWIKYMWDIDVRYLTDVGCRMHVYLTHGFNHFSSWLLVVVTVDRTISIVSPYKAKLRCTPRNAGIAIAALFVIVFGIDLLIPITTSLKGYHPLKGQDIMKCEPSNKNYFFRDIWQWIDLSLTYILPFVFLFILNTIITWNLHKARCQCDKHVLRGTDSLQMESNTWSVIMLALCTLFFLTMTPVSVFQIYYQNRYEDGKMSYEDRFKGQEGYQYIQLQHAIVNLVSYTNASSNFMLYVFCDSKFRTELKAVLCCVVESRRNLSVSTNNCKRDLTVLNSSGAEKQISKAYDNHTYNGYKQGEVNIVFADVTEASSVSSIFAKHKADGMCLETSVCENNENIPEESAVIIINFDTIVDGKEWNGFMLYI